MDGYQPLLTIEDALEQFPQSPFGLHLKSSCTNQKSTPPASLICHPRAYLIVKAEVEGTRPLFFPRFRKAVHSIEESLTYTSDPFNLVHTKLSLLSPFLTS